MRNSNKQAHHASSQPIKKRPIRKANEKPIRRYSNNPDSTILRWNRQEQFGS